MYFLSGTSSGQVLGQEGIGKYRKITHKISNICSIFFSITHIKTKRKCQETPYFRHFSALFHLAGEEGFEPP